MTNYMIAVDGSEHSEKAYAIAAKLISEGDTVHFITVTPKLKAKDDEQSAAFRQKEQAKALLEKWERKATDDGFNARGVLAEAADAREAICEKVEENQIDILVVGTRGLGTIKRMFLGSVSNYCVQHANCDVIVAK